MKTTIRSQATTATLLTVLFVAASSLTSHATPGIPPVPDVSSTMPLLGSAMAALVLFGRRLRK